jgi:para-aminobenzoate synthetase component 1
MTVYSDETAADVVRVHRIERVCLRWHFHRYVEMFAGQSYAFLLDSAKLDARLGRFSFVGGMPRLVYRVERRTGPGAGEVECLSFDPQQASRRYFAVDVFDDFRELLRSEHVPQELYSDAPVPFLAGAVGVFGYEARHFIERLPDRARREVTAPDICFMFVDSVLAHCHEAGESYLSIIGRGRDHGEAVRHADALRERWLARLAAFEGSAPPAWQGPSPTAAGRTTVEVSSQFDEASYSQLVDRAKEHIAAGDIFEVCTAHRLQSPLVGTAWELYCELRRINPAPFAAYLVLPELTIVCSSPERFLRVDALGRAESRPIKGTRPRGDNPAEDARRRFELQSSPKDRAENVMIVDLLRNDLGRVCQIGSVRVPEVMVVEEYATVFQLVSTIVGQLRPECDAIDLVRASFPGGSMTGAPKIEAMKIIDTLEPVQRGLYSGAIGYFDLSGAIDLNIVIRTLIVQNGQCYFHAGGAVVADSDPRAEYRETLDKAHALITALRNVKAVYEPDELTTTAAGQSPP